MRTRLSRPLLIILAIMALAVPASAVRAQEGEDFGNTPQARASIPTRSTLPGRGSGEVTLGVRSLGIGNTSRQGEWEGMLIEVTDSSPTVRNVLINVTCTDLDGDQALMQRVIVTNPGTPQLVWLYLRLPFAQNDQFDIRAFEAIGSADAEGQAQQYRPGRMLGVYRYAPNSRFVLPPSIGLIAVVGQPAGLDQYRWVADQRGDFAVSGHELTEIVQGVPLAALPDRWAAYGQFQALVWTSRATEDNPLNMRKEQAAAIREYVQHGGHFIVVLPTVAQQWLDTPSNPLDDIMPKVKVTRTEGVDLAKFRSLITRDPDTKLPADAVVQSFTSAQDGGWPQDTMPVMTGLAPADPAKDPPADVVVVRRLVGCGMVTVIGLDVASTKLQLTPHGFLADQFWNRVLGKRLALPTPAQLSAGMKGATPMPGVEPVSYDYNATPVQADASVRDAVNNEETAGLGLLLAFVVFLAYWLVAGPLGYFALKQRNLKQHAWVAFVASIGIFTAVAWSGANILKPRRVHGRHLTFVQGVYGQTVQSARSWIGLYLPRYGEQEVSVASESSGGQDWHNTLATWDPQSSGGSVFSEFPDARGYVVDARRPDTAAFPARATTKQMQVDWTGGLPADWVMPHPQADPSVPVGKEIQLLPREKKLGERDWQLQGSIVHGLPAPLTNVHIVLIGQPTETPAADVPPNMRRQVYAVTLSGDGWKPGEPLVLDDLFGKLNVNLSQSYAWFDRLVPTPVGAAKYMTSAYDRDMMPSAVTFFDMLKCPDARKSNNDPSRVLLQRSTTHGLDLSRWFTQPCLIVLGELGERGEGVACPLSVRVDSIPGEQVRKRIMGRTVVRWVYPLDPAPFAAVELPAKKPQTEEDKP